ncbi:sulfite exporter TauE/SafE family protein [Gulosibacter molinativorax]|uniref:Probable membrane transporter protein n=1 Tax=Gulosibacter molinativorax TaxID=256821 RepID=A0ABT7CC07_9MICO|nr:sulfite exporter TauE/SafE family protein [Gulosibacter molinativorax]MDJ1372151.1 sulfite exporter TauE/SafE family protein [Gulosibacter molinativorax]QUY60978.1 transmembrane protein [Gulosibacter molinativorax]
MNTTAPAPHRNWLGLIITGLVVGIASGLFGVGGGILIVPVLVYLLRYDAKIASGTSLLAIVLPSVVGVTSYALQGNVDVLLAALLAVGSIVGAPIGSWLLTKVNRRVLQWIFIGFLIIVIVSLFLVIPSRDAIVHINVWTGVLLVLVGLFTGVASGLLGIGGGVIVVPVLVLLFGASDLVAKGSSLLMIIATGISGTVANVRNKNVDLPGALAIGLGAAVVTPLGVWLAGALSPQAANITFACFLVLVIARMAVDAWPRKKGRGA